MNFTFEEFFGTLEGFETCHVEWGEWTRKVYRIEYPDPFEDWLDKSGGEG